jgi:hypothetical protein
LIFKSKGTCLKGVLKIINHNFWKYQLHRLENRKRHRDFGARRTMILRYVAASGTQSAATGSVGNWKFVPSQPSYGSVVNSLAGENYTVYLVAEVNGNWAP